VFEGIKAYFDRALPVCLLYRFERPQLAAFLGDRPAEDGRPMSHVYGAPHLLRLLVRLPELLREAPSITRDEADALGAHLADFVKCVVVATAGRRGWQRRRRRVCGRLAHLGLPQHHPSSFSSFSHLLRARRWLQKHGLHYFAGASDHYAKASGAYVAAYEAALVPGAAGGSGGSRLLSSSSLIFDDLPAQLR
jgi:hypothetical protein